MKQIVYIFIAFATIVTFGQELSKEKMYEAKKQLRNGNKAYETKQYADAAIAYQKSLAEDGTYFKGAYNLGNAYYSQKKYKEAVEQYQLAHKLTKSKKDKAELNELMGDSFKNQKELEKALEAYKQALLKNPKDDILRQKFVAAKQAKQKQDEQKKDDENKDDKEGDDKDNKENKDGGDQEKNKDDKGDKEDEKKDDKDGDQNKDQGDKDNKDQNSDKKDGNKGDDKKEKGKEGQQPQESKLSPQQMEQLLESMSNEEQKTQEKVNAQKVKAKTNRNEKDW